MKGNGNFRKTQNNNNNHNKKKEMQPPTLTNFRGMNAHLRIYSVKRQTILLVNGEPLGRERVKNLRFDKDLSLEL